MPTVVEELKNQEPLFSMALGCIEAARVVKEAYDAGVDVIVNPSRGVSPVFRGILKALQEYANQSSEYKKVYEAIKVPPQLSDEFIHDRNINGKNRPLYVMLYPLTADISLSEEYLKKAEISLDRLVDHTRMYGAEVISTFALPPEERKKNDKFNFLSFLFREIEGRNGEAQYYEKHPQVKKALLIDTVISGRSLSTVLNTLSNFELEHNAIGIVDRNGAKLRAEYKKILDEKGVELIPVDRIISEDRGAAFLGVIGCVYPTLALAAERDLDIRPCGAVTWHHISYNQKENTSSKMRERCRIYHEAFQNFIGGLYSAIEYLIRPNPSNDSLESMNERINNLIELIETHELLEREPEIDPKMFVRDDFRILDVYESSSHVIHLIPDPKDVERYFDNFNKNYRAPRRK